MKLIILQGPPCSGKSTWVKEFLCHLDDENASNWVVVSGDDIRTQLNDGVYKYDEQTTPFVRDIEKHRVRYHLMLGYNVIVDATNLEKEHIKVWKDIAKEFSCDVEFKLFCVPFNEAMRRSEQRKNDGGVYITKEVMLSYYEKHFKELLK